MTSAVLQGSNDVFAARFNCTEKDTGSCQLPSYFRGLETQHASMVPKIHHWNIGVDSADFSTSNNIFLPTSGEYPGRGGFPPNFLTSFEPQITSMPLLSAQPPTSYSQQHLTASTYCASPGILHSHECVEAHIDAENKLDQISIRSNSVNPNQSQCPPSKDCCTSPPPSAETSKRKRGRSKSNRGPNSNCRGGFSSPPTKPSSERDLFLERNRAAAHRCRQKKKEWAAQLDERCRDLKVRNLSLEKEAGRLWREVYELKNLLLHHSNCKYGPIDTYIANTTETVHSKFVLDRKA